MDDRQTDKNDGHFKSIRQDCFAIWPILKILINEGQFTAYIIFNASIL